MSTLSPNKNFVIPTVGADFNNWGTELNGTVGQLDLALGGEATVNCAGSANVTLTSTQAQNLIYLFTGLLTGNIQVLFPATKGLYLISNATTGAFTLTVGTTNSGTTVLLPQGYFMIVYCDGTNIAGLNAVPTLGVVDNAFIGGTLNVTDSIQANALVVDAEAIISGEFTASAGATLQGALQVSGALIAAAGTNQGTATPLPNGFALITSGGAGAGVGFQALPLGSVKMIANMQGAGALMYPPAGGAVYRAGITGGTNGGVTLPGSTTTIAFCDGNGNWFCT